MEGLGPNVKSGAKERCGALEGAGPWPVELAPAQQSAGTTTA